MTTEKQFFETFSDLFNLFYTVYDPKTNYDEQLSELGGLLYEIGSNFDNYKEHLTFSDKPN